MLLSPLDGFFPKVGAGSLKKPRSGPARIIATAQRKVGVLKKGVPTAINIRATLDKVRADAGRQTILRSAINRLEGIRQGLITPQEGWETTAAYLMLSGSPFKLDVSPKGKIIVDSQAQSKLSEFADTQKKAIISAINQLAPLYDKVDLAEKKEDLRVALKFAVVHTVQLDNHYPAKKQWEKDYNLYKSMGYPQKLHLDSKGKLTMINQYESDFSYVEKIDDRLKLQRAVAKLKRIRDGLTERPDDLKYFKNDFAHIADTNERNKLLTAVKKLYGFRNAGRGATTADQWKSFETEIATIGDINERNKLQTVTTRTRNFVDNKISASESWEYSALGYQLDKDDYFLYINDKGNVAVSRNKSAKLVIPDFLQPSDDDKPKITAKWQGDAIALYKEKKSFHFGFAYDGKIKVLNNDLITLSGILNPKNNADKILKARLDMFA